MSMRARGLEILARSLFRDMLAGGYKESDVILLATKLIGEVTDSLSSRRPDPPAEP
jgi:hypothetical protein